MLHEISSKKTKSQLKLRLNNNPGLRQLHNLPSILLQQRASLDCHHQHLHPLKCKKRRRDTSTKLKVSLEEVSHQRLKRQHSSSRPEHFKDHRQWMKQDRLAVKIIVVIQKTVVA